MATDNSDYKEICKLIQWEKVHTINGESVCPECHEPAEMILGIFGQPCYAHKMEKL